MNDFDFNNRSYRVYVQADQQFRSKPDDIERYYVRTSAGQMMPLSNVVSVREATAPKTISHYNLFRSAEINGSAAPGFSSGQAIRRWSAVGPHPAAGHDATRGRGCRSRRSRRAASRR